MRRLVAAAAAALAIAGTAGAAPIQPDDPAWADAWGLRKIGLPDVWGTTTGDPQIVIAVVDTGVSEIPDLEGALVPGIDLVESDAVKDDVHGTRVASVIAARGNDGAGMAGHCWRCRIMPVRVVAGRSAPPARLGAGITWAVDHGARIVNVSLSHPGADPVEAAAVSYALSRGVVVVAAAGNGANDTPQYPAAYPGVLSVGGSDEADALYFWSSRGPWVRLTAPGCQMVADASTAPGTLCGTSFTPAAVSGVAGLLLSANPGLTATQVVETLLRTAHPVAGTGGGRIDAAAAFRSLGLLQAAASGPPPPVAPAPGQRFTRQTIFETGTFRGGFRRTFTIGRGRFELQLLTPLAAACSLVVLAADELIVASPAVRNLLSLSVQLPAGRYTVAVRCGGTRSRHYSLGVSAMLGRAGP